jgi:hypothetical protein
MSRTDRDADVAYQTLANVASLIRLRDYKSAVRLADKAQLERQNREYDRAARGGDEHEALEHARARGPSKAERSRERLFTLANTTRILAPVNVLEVYLSEHPMWDSSTWERDVSARMLPFVQELDPADRLPADERLALPFTVIACTLSQALHLSPALPRVDLTAEVYRLVVDGIVTLDRLVAPDGLAEDFAHVADAARLLLLHAVSLGLEAWGQGLILRCALEGRCKLQQPFYVNAPKETAGHVNCRVAEHRRRLRLVKPDVTRQPTKPKN